MHSPPTTGCPSFASDEERWAAVQARRRDADDRFVYAVATTGVFCRPSCPSRHARRENVRFFTDAAAAEKAGYRACRRCTPTGPAPGDRHAAAIAQACRRIEQASELPDLDALAQAAGMSRYHFQRVFKSLVGVTPGEYARGRRAERMRRTLPTSPSVTDALYDAGYNANSRFYEQSRRSLGMTPGAYRDGGRGTRIRFAVAATTLGAVLVAATEAGVCAILLGDDADRLVRDIQDMFPNAELIGADPGFEATVARVIAQIEDSSRRFDLPLDVRGSAFQIEVWNALSKIPHGSTATYAGIAAALGRPSAVRAVAQACASNRLAVVVPCHRVVRSDGNVSGYRWGVERKKALLQREAARAEATQSDSADHTARAPID